MYKPRRKTISVEKMKLMINTANKSVYGTREQRQGANSILEHVLHETGNYKGFWHYRADELPNDRRVKAGIIFDSVNHNHEFPDDSRVFYF